MAATALDRVTRMRIPDNRGCPDIFLSVSTVTKYCESFAGAQTARVTPAIVESSSDNKPTTFEAVMQPSSILKELTGSRDRGR